MSGTTAVAAAVALVFSCLAVRADAELPRVMSLNLCTDQLLLELAAPGQIVSLSNLSTDPSLSFAHEAAEAYPRNSGSAEEVFLAQPDLVVTGTFGLHGTDVLLRRLGYPVETFAFDQSLGAIPAELRRMGELIGRAAQGERTARRFEAELARISAGQCGRAPTIVAYEPNGVVPGAGTLADSAIRAAGFRNLAAELGYAAMTPMPLEALISAAPDVISVAAPMADAPALGDRMGAHPALRALDGTRIGTFVPSRAWTCEGPGILHAVRALDALRREIAPCPQAPET